MRICLVARAGLELVTFRSQSRRFPSTPHMSTNVEIKNGKYDNEMCELPCTVIITVKKGNIVYIMHDVSHEILILDTI